MDRLTDKRAVLLALDDAIEWQKGLVDANAGDPVQQAEHQRYIDAYRRVMERISGNKLSISELYQKNLDANSRSVGLAEIRAMSERGELSNKFGDE